MHRLCISSLQTLYKKKRKKSVTIFFFSFWRTKVATHNSFAILLIQFFFLLLLSALIWLHGRSVGTFLVQINSDIWCPSLFKKVFIEPTSCLHCDLHRWQYSLMQIKTHAHSKKKRERKKNYRRFNGKWALREISKTLSNHFQVCLVEKRKNGADF